jgi:hypothetical protein
VDIVSTQQNRTRIRGQSVGMRDDTRRVMTLHARTCGVYTVVNVHIQHSRTKIHMIPEYQSDRDHNDYRAGCGIDLTCHRLT